MIDERFIRFSFFFYKDNCSLCKEKIRHWNLSSIYYLFNASTLTDQHDKKKKVIVIWIVRLLFRLTRKIWSAGENDKKITELNDTRKFVQFPFNYVNIICEMFSRINEKICANGFRHVHTSVTITGLNRAHLIVLYSNKNGKSLSVSLRPISSPHSLFLSFFRIRYTFIDEFYWFFFDWSGKRWE